VLHPRPSTSPTVSPTPGKEQNPPPPTTTHTASLPKVPSAVLTASPSFSPTPERGQNPPPETCEETCDAYVLENCVVRTASTDFTKDKACVVVKGCRFLQSIGGCFDCVFARVKKGANYISGVLAKERRSCCFGGYRIELYYVANVS
jgi:hypothetical protein